MQYIQTMKNSRITYHKERTRREFKDIIVVKRNIIEKYIILSGSFLMIFNAFKQFPDLNVLHLKLLRIFSVCQNNIPS